MPQPYSLRTPDGDTPSDDWVRVGIDLHTRDKIADAADRYRQALYLNPQNVIALQNLAIAQAQLPGQLNDGLQSIYKARILSSRCPYILSTLSLMCMEGGWIEEALDNATDALFCLDPSIHKGADHIEYCAALVYPISGYPAGAEPLYESILSRSPNDLNAGNNLCFIRTLMDIDTKTLQDSYKKWYESYKYRGPIAPHNNLKYKDKVLKVGYVSGDFKSHSAAFIFSRVLLHHSERITPYFYSTLPVDEEKDKRTKTFKSVASKFFRHNIWRDIYAPGDDKADEKADALIRNDEIDILIDLSGYTGGGRLPLFSRRPAPIQITAWGFAHGTGMSEMDYFFADPVTVPQDEREYFAEKIIDLPCIVTLEPPDDCHLPISKKLPYRENGYVTFGCFGRFEKVSDQYLQCCKKILMLVEGSKMLFKDHAYTRPYSVQRVINSMCPEVSSDRLLFSGSSSHEAHLKAYQQVDICLDPFPHGGGVVALEQLYMGVPVITLYGRQPSGRSAASVLKTLKLDSYVAYDQHQYVNAAYYHASKIDETSTLRKKLRQMLVESPIVAGYVDAVEEAYRKCWYKYCES